MSTIFCSCYGALTNNLQDYVKLTDLTSQFKTMKIMASGQTGSSSWGDDILKEKGNHIYLIVCNRFSIADSLIMFIFTYGVQESNVTSSVYSITNNGFSYQTNASGTLAIQYCDSANTYSYSYCLMKLI